MLNPLNISSGSNFSKKIFSTQNISNKPSLIHSGKIFSNNIFTNTKITPLLTNDMYYVGHGLIDGDVIIDYSVSSSFSDESLEGQSIIETDNLAALNVSSNNTGKYRTQSAFIKAATSSFTGSTTNIIIDPYTNNPPPGCDVP